MDNIWIVGAGDMAIEYVKVLKALGRRFIVIGRSEQSAKKLKEATGVDAILGGLDSYLSKNTSVPEFVINCVPVLNLNDVNLKLLDYGVKKILSEKPGVYNPDDINELASETKNRNANLYIAYNRRFYASVNNAEKIIKEDGGLLSCNFEFTEWAHVFDAMPSPEINYKHLFLGNSTHVVDLAFFLCGEPKEMACYSAGTTGWHTPAIFSGAGVTKKQVLFSYCANWNAPGRWAVELLTPMHRIYLKPMEQLQLQDKGSIKVYPVEIDDRLDKEFKPGLYLETKAFLEGDSSRLCSIIEQKEHIHSIYNKMMGK